MFTSEKFLRVTKSHTSKLWNTGIVSLKTSQNNLLYFYFIIYSFQHFFLTFQVSIEIQKSLIGPINNHILQIPQFLVGLYQIDFEKSSSLMGLFLALCSVYIAFLSIFLLAFCICFWRGSKIPNKMRKIYELTKDFHLLVLSQPIFNFLIKFAFELGKEDDLGIKGAGLFGTALLIIFNWIFAGLSILTNSFTLEESILERSNDFIFEARFVTNILNGAYLGYCLSNPAVGLNKNFTYLNAFSNCVETIVLVYSVPYFNSQIMRVALACNSISVGLALSNILVSEFLTENGFIIESIILLGLVISSLVFKAEVMFLNDETPYSFLDKSSLRIVNEYWMIRRIKLFLFAMRSSDHALDTLALNHTRVKLLVFSNNQLLISKSSLESNKNLIFSEKLIALFQEMANSHEYSSSFKIWIYKFLVEQGTQTMQIYSLIQKRLRNEKKTIIKMRMRTLLENIHDSVQKNLDPSGKIKLMRDFLESIKTKIELNNRVQAFLSLQKQLFALLEIYNPDLLAVEELASTLTKKTSEIQKFWEKIPTNFWEMNPDIVKIYSSFIQLYDETLYKALTITYKSLLTKHVPKHNLHANEIEITINRKSGFILTSVEQSDFGKILLCTGNVTSFLKYTPGKLDGRSIQTIIPYLLYDDYMKKLDDQIQNLLLTNDLQAQFSVGMSSEGYLVPYEEVSYFLPNENYGLCKWSYFNFDKYHFEYMLLDADGNIHAATKHIAKDLGLKLEEKPNLSDVTEQPVTHASLSMIIHTRLKKKINILLPYNNSLMYKCEVQNSDNEKYYFLKAMKSKSKMNNYIDVEENSIFDFSQNKILDNTGKKNNNTKSKIDLNGTFGAYSDTRDNEIPIKSKKNLVLDIGECSEGSSKNEKESDSDFSSRHYSYNQSSVHSALTNMEHKESGYKTILRSMEFTKYPEKYYPIIATVLFVAIYIFSIRFSYEVSQNLITKISTRLDLYNILSGRVRYTMEVCRNAYGNLLYQNYYPNGTARQISNIGQMRFRLGNLTKFNNELRKTLDDIDDLVLTRRFYEKHVKVYNEDFLNILTTDKYSTENSFIATNLLINQGNILIRKAREDDDVQHFLMEYIMTNSFNDLTIENENLFDFILEDINTEIKDTTKLEEDLMITTLSLLAFSSFVLMVIIYISYRKTVNFLSAFVDPSSKILSQTIIQGTSEAHYSSKSKHKKNEISAHKMPKQNRIFKRFLFKYFLIQFIMALPEIVHVIDHYNIKETIQNIGEHLNDLVNLNEIRIHGVYSINLQMMSVVYPNGYSFYTKNSQNFDSLIKKLDSLISIKLGFSDEALSLLHADLCNYYLNNPIRPKCGDLSKGVAHQGITSTILSLQTYYSQLEKRIEATNHSKILLAPIITETEFLDNYYLVSNAMSPALEVFQKDITELLHSELNSSSTSTLILFSCGIVLGVALILVIIFMFWVIFGGKMNTLAELIRLVPEEYLLRSRELKSYLLKQSKDASHFFKMIERRHNMGN